MKPLLLTLFTLFSIISPLKAAYDFGQTSHVPSVNIKEDILFNGRIYDPEMGRFLSADPVIQDPNDLQSYNRYSYVSNNPLTYTDPTGYNQAAMEQMRWLAEMQLKKQIGTNKAEVVIAVNHAIDSALGKFAGETAVNFTPILGDIVGGVEDTAGVLDSNASTGSRGFSGASLFLSIWGPSAGKMKRSFTGAIDEVTNIAHASDLINDASHLTDSRKGMQSAIDVLNDSAPSSSLVSGVDNVIAPAKRETGQTVLGKYPDYVNLSEETAARRFEIPTDIWNQMTPAEQWTANQKFLDRTILKGDDIILSNPVKDIKDVGGYYRRELDYLMENGYHLNKDGTRLIK